MSFIHPPYISRLARLKGPEALAEMEAWSLTMLDVADATGTQRRTVNYWVTKGVKGHKLEVKHFSRGAATAMHVTSVTAVEKFLTLIGKDLPNWTMLPPHVQKRLNVGQFAPEEHEGVTISPEVTL